MGLKMVTLSILVMAAATVTPVASSSGSSSSGISAGNYTADWASIDSRPLPSWYDDVKIGLFIHCESGAQHCRP